MPTGSVPSGLHQAVCLLIALPSSGEETRARLLSVKMRPEEKGLEVLEVGPHWRKQGPLGTRTPIPVAC